MQSKPLNVEMAEILAKLDAKPSVDEGAAGRIGNKIFDFLRGLGKGDEKYGAKTRIEPFLEAIKKSQAEADEALVKAALQKPRITPAEIAAARAEGITTQEWLIKNKPEFYATLEKAAPEEQVAFYDIVKSTAGKYEPESNMKTALAASVTAHIILLAILTWKSSKTSPKDTTTSSTGSTSSTSSSSGAPATSSGSYYVRRDSIDWDSMGAPGFKGQGASKQNGKWVTDNGTPITDPKQVKQLEAALQKQLSTPMTVYLHTEPEAQAIEKGSSAKVDKETPVSTVQKSPIKQKVDPKRRPDFEVNEE